MGLKIAVLVKQVPDHEAIVQLKSDRELDIEERYVCSFFDEVAIEAALHIKKSSPDVEVFALSAGGRRAVDALRRAVAMGIDDVEHIGDETLETADNYYTARVLAARLKACGPDLIICGKQAGDDDAAAVGPMVAAQLNVPHASAAVSLEMTGAADRVKIGREAEGEVQYFESGFPLLVTAEKGLAEPHVPVVMRVMKAMKAQPTHIPIEELGLEGVEPRGRVRRLRYAAPPERPPVTMIEQPFPENVVELVNHLRQGGIV